MSRFRVVLKASLLAGASLNPLYLSSIAIIVDIILLMVEYKLRNKQLICPITWLLSDLFIWLALLFYFFVPDSFLTLGFVIFYVVLALVSEGYIFYWERKLDRKMHISMFEREMGIGSEELCWDLEKKS